MKKEEEEAMIKWIEACSAKETYMNKAYSFYIAHLSLLVESLGFQLRGLGFESLCMCCVCEFALNGLNVPKKAYFSSHNKKRDKKELYGNFLIEIQSVWATLRSI
ncbi:hypothetical protein KFK09_005123 [Dendrobium nobile]|uniref:Uncharacterized protein n=1 Tax=Dendrobium nobile TaxID=94219 RepID=A0A8T3BYB3_DENNO|nr:hypothetical protein KFK09_005123 [Dendrobium nobile]